MYIIRVTLGSKLPAFSASRQLMARRQKADAMTSRLNITAVSGRSGARLMRVIPQRELGGEMYVRPGTCALLSDSLHNICPTGQNLGGTNNIGVPPLQILGGDASPRPPDVYAYDLWYQLVTCPLPDDISKAKPCNCMKLYAKQCTQCPQCTHTRKVLA